MVYTADVLTQGLKNFTLGSASIRDSVQELGFDQRTIVESVQLAGLPVSRFTNEFWTAGQRQGHALHEISYRACFKAELPRFFIERLTEPGELIYDPFMGRGTSLLEAALLGRRVAGNDVNPLSRILLEPRLEVPDLTEIAARLESLAGAGRVDRPEARQKESLENGRAGAGVPEIDLSMFYSAATLRQILALREYLAERRESGTEDAADRWIRMVATNRLTGHSPGFFSVYTLPPNQAVSPQAQQKINVRRSQVPPDRDVTAIMLKKSRTLQKDLTTAERRRLRQSREESRFFAQDARLRTLLEDDSVALAVTSPPFLNTVQYAEDNWLRCWFNGLDAERIGKGITVTASLSEWTTAMTEALRELRRVLRPGGWIAFEVGEVRRGKVRLDEIIAPAGSSVGLHCRGIMINQQDFTKTSNCWGVANNSNGTNSNRIVLLQK